MRNTLKLSKQKVFPVACLTCPDYWFLKHHKILPATSNPEEFLRAHFVEHSINSADSRKDLGISKTFATSFSCGLSSLAEWKSTVRCTSVPLPTTLRGDGTPDP